jgi:signal peptidase I
MSDVLEQPATEPATPPQTAPPRRSGWAASLQSLAVTVVIAVFVITFLVQAFQIPSESMENTLLIGDYLLVDKVHYGHGGVWGEILPYAPIRRGDIIVFRYPVHPQQHFVKRVIGLPGEQVRMVQGRVLVNGVPLQENYAIHTRPVFDHFRDDFPLTDIPSYNTDPRWWQQLHGLVHDGQLTVPPGAYFVLGDNRDESLDSRYWGLVPRRNIIGRPLVIYWSLRSPRASQEPGDSWGDKLSVFLHGLTHVVQETRWDRTLRIVR